MQSKTIADNTNTGNITVIDVDAFDTSDSCSKAETVDDDDFDCNIEHNSDYGCADEETNSPSQPVIEISSEIGIST